MSEESLRVPGVLLLLSLIALMLVDDADLSDGWKQVVRTTIPLSAILLPVAFFLWVMKPEAEQPTRLVNLAYVGAVLVAIGTAALGVGLLRAP